MNQFPLHFFTDYSLSVDETASLVASTTLASEIDCGCDGEAKATPKRYAGLRRRTSFNGNDRLSEDMIHGDQPLGTSQPVRWKGIIGIEGELTGDGRFIQPGALRWENLPIPLRYVSADVGAHSGAVVVGRIDKIERDVPTGLIFGEGDFDMGSEVGREAARQVRENLMRGVSMDLDDVAFEVRIAADAPALMMTDPQALVAEGTPDADGRVKVQEMAPDDEVMVTTDARVRAATIVAVPAFSRAMLGMADEVDEVLTASGGSKPRTSFLLKKGETSDSIQTDEEPLKMPPANSKSKRKSAEKGPATKMQTIDVTLGGVTYKAQYPEKAGAYNWVDDVGGLPEYIRDIADALMRKGKAEGHAIAIAVNVVKQACETGDLNFPGKQDATAKTKAKACAAVAEWEAKKAKAKADAGETKTMSKSAIRFNRKGKVEIGRTSFVTAPTKGVRFSRKGTVTMDSKRTQVFEGWNPEKQWRDSKGRFIDMPNVSLDKLADFFGENGSLRDAPDSVREAVDAVVEQRGGMEGGPDSPEYAESVQRAVEALGAVENADTGDMAPEDVDTLETQIEKVGIDLNRFLDGYIASEQTDIGANDAAPMPDMDPGRDKSTAVATDREGWTRLTNPDGEDYYQHTSGALVAQTDDGYKTQPGKVTTGQDLPDLGPFDEANEAFDAVEAALSGDGGESGNSIPDHWKNEGNSQLSEEQWQAASAHGLHPGVLEPGPGNYVHIRKTEQTYEGMFDPETGAVFYKQPNGDWMQYGPEAGPKPPGGMASYYPKQTNHEKNPPWLADESSDWAKGMDDDTLLDQLELSRRAVVRGDESGNAQTEVDALEAEAKERGLPVGDDKKAKAFVAKVEEVQTEASSGSDPADWERGDPMRTALIAVRNGATYEEAVKRGWPELDLVDGPSEGGAIRNAPSSPGIGTDGEGNPAPDNIDLTPRADAPPRPDAEGMSAEQVVADMKAHDVKAEDLADVPRSEAIEMIAADAGVDAGTAEEALDLFLAPEPESDDEPEIEQPDDSGSAGAHAIPEEPTATEKIKQQIEGLRDDPKMEGAPDNVKRLLAEATEADSADWGPSGSSAIITAAHTELDQHVQDNPDDEGAKEALDAFNKFVRGTVEEVEPEDGDDFGDLPGDNFPDTAEGASANLANNADAQVNTMLAEEELNGGKWIPDPEVDGVWGFEDADGNILVVSYNEEGDFELSEAAENRLAGGDDGPTRAEEGQARLDAIALSDELLAELDAADGREDTDSADMEAIRASLAQGNLDDALETARTAGLDAIADEIEKIMDENGFSGSTMVAAAAPFDPEAPPVAHFSNPNLKAPTALTVTPDGRVFGHLATWGTCHLTHTNAGKCVVPPKSQTGYAYFHTGSVVTKEGAEIPVGQITLNTRHAKDSFRPVQALAHYDNTGLGVADVVVGEDSHGIWVSGSLRPGVDPKAVRTLRASPLSGDWRRVGGGMELVAALAVNVPGFPVPRPKGRVQAGVMTSLVAAGMLPPAKVRRPFRKDGTRNPDALSTDDLRYLKSLAERERRNEMEQKMATLDRAQALAQRLSSTRKAETLDKAAALRAKIVRDRAAALAAKLQQS